MHVAFDLRLIPHSGIGTYVRGLLEGFAELDSPVEWTFVGPRVELPSALRVRNWIEFDAPLYSAAEFRGYPRLPDVDLFHHPHYNLPLTQAPRRVVTVHDLFHLRFGGLRQRVYQRFFVSRLAWTKTHVIAVSEKTHREIGEWARIADSRMTTILSGPGKPIPRDFDALKNKTLVLSDGRRLEPPWLLAAGIDKPHKNFDFLIESMAHWYRRRSGAPPLVWVGMAAEEVEKRTASIPAHARAKIHLEPFRPGGEIEAFYAGASALIFPSLDEGFGLPPLEAMARGVPVLCSRRAPMTELLATAPLWFEPNDASTLWRPLDRLLDEPGLREEVVERGLIRAQRFSWKETARRTLEVYGALCERG